MKTIQNAGAQGDVMFIRAPSLPSGLAPKPAEAGRHILAHSETGHHHWTSADGVELYQGPESAFTCYLRNTSIVHVEHARPFDTHETIALPPGTWLVRRQREYTPEGFRRVED
jgi:hypothetical protein